MSKPLPWPTRRYPAFCIFRVAALELENDVKHEWRMATRVLIVLLALTALILAMIVARTYDGGNEDECPDMTREQITSDIHRYLGQLDKSYETVAFDEVFEYAPGLKEWRVPYKIDGHRWVARVTCANWVVENIDRSK